MLKVPHPKPNAAQLPFTKVSWQLKCLELQNPKDHEVNLQLTGLNGE